MEWLLDEFFCWRASCVHHTLSRCRYLVLYSSGSMSMGCLLLFVRYLQHIILYGCWTFISCSLWFLFLLNASHVYFIKDAVVFSVYLCFIHDPSYPCALFQVISAVVHSCLIYPCLFLYPSRYSCMYSQRLLYTGISAFCLLLFCKKMILRYTLKVCLQANKHAK